jgi:hypothetical protein
MEEHMSEVPVISGPPYWGVDSVAPADKPFGDAPTLYDYVVNCSKGKAPAFFGRYLTPAEYQKITDSEIQFLRSKGCKLILNYNQLSSGTVAVGGAAGRASGRAHATKAAFFAAQIGAPAIRFGPIVYLYANIDSGYIPTVDWIVGWWDGLWDNGFGPGLYYPAAGSKKIGEAVKLCKIPDPEFWISLWSWSGASRGSTNVNVDVFSPAPPFGHFRAVDVWQYAYRCFPYGGDTKKCFDMNLASQTGYDIMWAC